MSDIYLLFNLSELESPLGLDSISQVEVAIGALLLIGISSLGFLLDSTMFFDPTKEVPLMNKILVGIIIVTKSIISISVNISANLLTSACTGSQVHS
jgi:hypothetical protein